MSTVDDGEYELDMLLRSSGALSQEETVLTEQIVESYYHTHIPLESFSLKSIYNRLNLFHI